VTVPDGPVPVAAHVRRAGTPERLRDRRRRLGRRGWIVVILVLLLGLGAAYYVRSNLPADLTRAGVVGTWVSADGGRGVAVFRADGTAVFDDIPGGAPESGNGRWRLSDFHDPTVTVQVGSAGFDLHSKWDGFRTVLITYTGDPDDPRSEHTFLRR